MADIVFNLIKNESKIRILYIKILIFCRENCIIGFHKNIWGHIKSVYSKYPSTDKLQLLCTTKSYLETLFLF